MSTSHDTDMLHNDNVEDYADNDQQVLTMDEQSLIAAYRRAKPELRSRFDSLVDLPKHSDPEGDSAIGFREVLNDLPIKRRHPSEEGEEAEPPAKKPRTSDDAADRLNFDQTRNPETPYFCLIQIDNGPPIGSLIGSLDGLAPVLFVDAGLRRNSTSHRSPSLEVVFRCPGSRGKIASRKRWSLDDYVSGHWGIKSLAIVRVKDVQPTHARQTSAVLAACPPDSQHRLFCINLSVAVHREGFVNGKLLESANPGEEEKALFNSLFGYKKGYTVRLWIVLSDKGYQAEEACLEAMRYLFEQRIPPLALVQDKNGEFFLPQGKDSRSGIE